MEQYFTSFGRTNIHDIRSAGKSITSMLAGVAMEKELFKPTDKVLSFFPRIQKHQKSRVRKSPPLQ